MMRRFVPLNVKSKVCLDPKAVNDKSEDRHASINHRELTMEAWTLLLTSFITFSFFFLSSFPLSHSLPGMEEYRKCHGPFACGKLLDVGYPYWAEKIRPRYCGRPEFELHCPKPEHEHDWPFIQIGSQTFNVTSIDPLAYKMKVVRTDFVCDNCSSHLTDTSVSTPFNVFRYDGNVKNVTLFYDCHKHIRTGKNKFTCRPGTSSKPNNYAFYREDAEFGDLTGKCEHQIEVPVLNKPDSQALLTALGKEFDVIYDVGAGSCPSCFSSNGICGSNETSPFTCYCRDGPHPLHCYDSSNSSWPRKTKLTIIGVTSGTGAALLICIAVFCCTIKSRRQKGDQNIEAFIRNQGAMAVKRYKFTDIKKINNSLKEKLGQGGYGVVYKGKLLNGRHVAVKILKTSKGNGEEFINEVASIGRTSHINVVTLLGFCLEGRKKVLLYEFMSNGSLDKFIHKENETSPSLTWETLYQIAIVTAQGLEYLHKGCNTRIVHFDIKPHNILLDEDFCPKISDFGLAKLCPRKESIVSISEARGTIGYVAPEIWNRNIGGVSDKSNVYSYGMMLLDMVGWRKNMNAKANCTNEIYFPDCIYDQLEQGSDYGHDIAKKMTIVGLWCVLTFPTQRPTISRVIEMLERNVDPLEMPPKPVMSSPPRFELDSSTTSNTTT